MSNVTGIAGASGAALYGVPASSNVMLSPESLMYFCAIQLRSMDGQITKRMTEQQQARDAQEVLGQLQDLLAHLKPGGLNENDLVARRRILEYYKAAYDKAPPDMKARLQESFNAFRSTGCNNDGGDVVSLATYSPAQLDADATRPTVGNKNSLDSNEVTARFDEIKGICNDINKGAELEMTNLQTLISQRQMAIQMTTNLLSKVCESMQAIVNNTK